MKKLLLTSSGLSSEKTQKEFLSLLDKPVKEVKVLLIFGVKTPGEMVYVDASKMELINLGLKKENIADANINNAIDFPEGKFEVIYFCGGNTYYLLDRIKKLKFDVKIKDLVNDGALYIGVSAGSIIAGENIEIAGRGSEGDENEINLQDLSGLGFTDVAIFPHYRNDLKEEAEEFSKKSDYPVKALKDGEAILFLGGKVKELK
jgi:dipeptidase E